jgi:hypothetical protein
MPRFAGLPTRQSVQFAQSDDHPPPTSCLGQRNHVSDSVVDEATSPLRRSTTPTVALASTTAAATEFDEPGFLRMQVQSERDRKRGPEVQSLSRSGCA